MFNRGDEMDEIDETDEIDEMKDEYQVEESTDPDRPGFDVIKGEKIVETCPTREEA